MRNYYWENKSIRLRAMAADDWKKNYESCFDSEARRLLQAGIELPPTEAEEKQSTEKISNFGQPDNLIMFEIETLDSNAVGCVNLNSIDERHGTFSIGIQIYPEERGKGYGYLAMDKVLDYAFNERRLHKWNSACLESNTGSIALHNKLGCKAEGIRREAIYTNGRYCNELLFGLTAREYCDLKHSR